MVKIAIRDDDMNFFTKVKDIEDVYRNFGNFPISFAIIPRVLDVSTRGACSDTKGNTIPQDISKNTALVDYLKNRLSNSTCDILLHGLNHSYHFEGGARLAEMQWRSNQVDLCSELVSEKNKLSKLFGYKVSVFVAPSNKISKYCLKQVANAGLNFSGIIPLVPNVNLSIRNIINYFHRWFIRLVYHLPYPGVLKYDNHIEINACLLQSYDYLVKMFKFCKKHNLPMAINVHYWHLRDNPDELEILRKFIFDYAIPNGACPTTLSNLFK